MRESAEPETAFRGREGGRYSTRRPSAVFRTFKGVPDAALRASSPSALIAPIGARIQRSTARASSRTPYSARYPSAASQSAAVRLHFKRHPVVGEEALRQLGDPERQHLPDVVGSRAPGRRSARPRG